MALHRRDEWLLSSTARGRIVATVVIPQETAWRIFTKGITREAARAQVRVDGDTPLGEHVLAMLAIVG